MSEFGKLNKPEQRRVMRLKLHKRNEWKFISRIIPHKQVFNTPHLALGFIPVMSPVSKTKF